jgi:hypothetical protein
VNVLLIAVLTIAAFVTALWFTKLVPTAAGAIAVFRNAVSTFRDTTLSDDDRERIMQEGSKTLLRAFALIILKTTLALAVALLPIVLADRLGLVTAAEVFQFLARLDVIAVTTIAMTIGYYSLVRLWRR